MSHISCNMHTQTQVTGCQPLAQHSYPNHHTQLQIVLSNMRLLAVAVDCSPAVCMAMNAPIRRQHSTCHITLQTQSARVATLPTIHDRTWNEAVPIVAITAFTYWFSNGTQLHAHMTHNHTMP